MILKCQTWNQFLIAYWTVHRSKWKLQVESLYNPQSHGTVHGYCRVYRERYFLTQILWHLILSTEDKIKNGYVIDITETIYIETTGVDSARLLVVLLVSWYKPHVLFLDPEILTLTQTVILCNPIDTNEGLNTAYL